MLYRELELTELILNLKIPQTFKITVLHCISFSGDIQDPPGQGPLQPAVGDPALAGGLD